MYKDAIFFSAHKFVGGPETPGVLVAKKNLFRNPHPGQCGGGTVFFVSLCRKKFYFFNGISAKTVYVEYFFCLGGQVTPSNHRYFKEVELREEGGTPSIVGSIRAGLVVQLKEVVGSAEIMRREEQMVERVLSKWSSIPEVGWNTNSSHV